jgi:hypothetical protein
MNSPTVDDLVQWGATQGAPGDVGPANDAPTLAALEANRESERSPAGASDVAAMRTLLGKRELEPERWVALNAHTMIAGTLFTLRYPDPGTRAARRGTALRPREPRCPAPSLALVAGVRARAGRGTTARRVALGRVCPATPASATTSRRLLLLSAGRPALGAERRAARNDHAGVVPLDPRRDASDAARYRDGREGARGFGPALRQNRRGARDSRARPPTQRKSRATHGFAPSR